LQMLPALRWVKKNVRTITPNKTGMSWMRRLPTKTIRSLGLRPNPTPR
jgi:hypothetical protein